MLKIFGLALIVGLFAGTLGAAVLTFDIAPTPALNTELDPNYGQRVPNTFSSGGFSYGAAGGATPNVTVGYGTSVAAGAPCSFAPGSTTSCMYFWDNNFGDLTNVIAQAAQSGAAAGIINITLTADPGFLVTINSFDLAGWPNNGPTGSFGINGAEVLDGSSTVLWATGALSVPVNTGGHDHLTPGISGQVLQVRIDASNLGGGNTANVGIDNIGFSQLSDSQLGSVPEPATFGLIGSGLVALAAVSRRLRKQAR